MHVVSWLHMYVSFIDEMGWGQRVSVKWGRVVACGDTIENEVLIWVWALECVEDV